MDDMEKLEAIADIFDMDPSEITAETKLDTLDWDSMAMLSVIALAKAQGKTVAGSVIRGMHSVADVMAVL